MSVCANFFEKKKPLCVYSYMWIPLNFLAKSFVLAKMCLWEVYFFWKKSLNWLCAFSKKKHVCIGARGELKKTELGNREDVREIYMTRQFFKANDLQGHLSGKTKRPIIRWGLWEDVYQMSGVYRFSFGQEVWHK